MIEKGNRRAIGNTAFIQGINRKPIVVPRQQAGNINEYVIIKDIIVVPLLRSKAKADMIADRIRDSIP